MHVVISESTLLTALHEHDLLEDLFSIGHHFHVADLFLHHRELDEAVKTLLLSCGLDLAELSSLQMVRLKQLRGENPALCVGNLASLVLSEELGCPILAGNTGLGTMPVVVDRGLLDLRWVMDELEPRVASDRMRQSFESIVANTYYHHHLYSPEVAIRLQRYAAGANVFR